MSRSDPVRWGFLGAGGIARTALAPAVTAAAGAQLVAVAARDAARAAALAPDARAYGCYDDLLADEQVEAVYISLPNDAHVPWAVAAVAAGKHVLCEKPLGLDAAQVDRLASAARTHDRRAVEASMYRWHPRTRLAQRLLSEGAIGAVRHVSAGFTFPGQLDGNYRLERGRGGGALYDVGCYALSAVLWAMGWQQPTDVAARLHRGPTGVDLTAEAVITFPGGEAEVRAGMAEPERQWLVITGDDGEIELRDEPFTAWSGRDTELWLSDGRGTQRLPVPATDPYRVMVEETSAAVRGGEGWTLPLEQSRAVAALTDACFAAAGAPLR